MLQPSQFRSEYDDGFDISSVVRTLQRNILLIGFATMTFASAATFLAKEQDPVYRGSFEILAEPISLETGVISSINSETLSADGATKDSISMEVDDILLKLLESPQVLQPIADKLEPQYPQMSYENIVRNLSIKPLISSGRDGISERNILLVEYQSTDSEEIRDILPLIANAYLDFSSQKRDLDQAEGLRFVETQFEQSQERVESLEAKLKLLTQENNLISAEEQSSALSQQLQVALEESNDIRTQLTIKRSLYADLQQELRQANPNFIVTSTLMSPEYQNTITELQTIDIQLAEQLTRYQEEHPSIKSLRDEQQRIRRLLVSEGQRIQQNLGAQIKELEFTEQAYQENVGYLEGRVKQFTDAMDNLAKAEREHSYAVDTLDLLQEKREALRLETAQQGSPWELLTQPSSPRPITTLSSLLMTNLAIGTVLGFITGVGAALGLEQLKKVIYTPDEIKSFINRPVLGIIPYNRDLTKKGWAEISLKGECYSPRSDKWERKCTGSLLFQEASRVLATNIACVNPQQPIRSIVITSASTNAGKSTVSFLVAHAAATMGKKVLLVDADLRRPSIHNLSGNLNSKACGLCTLLQENNFLQQHNRITGSNLGLSNNVYQQPLPNTNPNLFVLIADSVPSNPTTLLSSNKLQRFFRALQDTFDLIVIDTPPVLGLADVFLVASNADGVALVVDLGVEKRDHLELTVKTLQDYNIPIIGLIANSRTKRSSKVYSQYYPKYY